METKLFNGEKKELSSIRKFVKDFLTQLNIEENLQYQLLLVIGEAAMNIVQHAYKGGNNSKKIKVELQLNDNFIQIDFYDQGDKADPKKIKPRKLEEIRPGGLGTHFIKMVMDEVLWLDPKAEWINHLRLIKKII